MGRKYKVLHLVEALDTGGLEKAVAEIAMHLNRDEFDVEIWCVHRDGKMVAQLRQQGIVVKVLGISTYHNPMSVIKLTKLFREAKADIVHTHVYFASSIGRVAGKLAGVKVMVNHVHSSYWHYHWGNLFIEWVLSKVTAKIICVSNSVREFVVNHEKINASRVQVIYNGITFRNGMTRTEARKNFNVSEPEIIITTVANLYRNKGHRVLLKALSLMTSRYKNIKCWIVGQGPLGEELKSYAKQLDLDSKTVFWGERQDVPCFLMASDIFVLPSLHREGLSVSVIEAMAYQVPVIVSRLGGLPEIVENQKNGLIVEPGDAEHLSRAMEDLIRDPQKRLYFAQEGFKKFKEHFQTNTMISQIEALYKECLK